MEIGLSTAGHVSGDLSLGRLVNSGHSPPTTPLWACTASILHLPLKYIQPVEVGKERMVRTPS